MLFITSAWSAFLTLTGGYQALFTYVTFASVLFGTLGGFFPGDAELAGEIVLYRATGLGQFALATVAVPTDGRTGNQHLRFLPSTLQPGQQGFRQADPTAP